MSSNSIKIATIALLVGGALGFGVNQYLSGANHDMSGTSGSAASSSNEPLYWVAPMDPNYKRDKPGKSPMGMDLIPVYAEDLAGEQDKPGTV
ncbi:heavy metal-binding domain-containing protein, partial [Vibrio sp. 1567]